MNEGAVFIYFCFIDKYLLRERVVPTIVDRGYINPGIQDVCNSKHFIRTECTFCKKINYVKLIFNVIIIIHNLPSGSNSL